MTCYLLEIEYTNKMTPQRQLFPLYNNDNNDLYSLREKCSYKAHTNDII